jgi:LacI family transcriptional regulator
MNDIRAGELAAAHLMDTGIRSFGFFGQSGHRWAEQRCEGFTSYVRRHCPTACISTWMRAVHTSDDDEDGGFNPKNVVAWLQSMPRPVGVMAACDDWARHLLYNCRLAGLNVPEDVAVIGADNDEFCCQTTSPPISSVILPLRRLGAEIGLMVDCLFSGRPLPRRRIVVDPTQIAIRRSSDVVAIPDPDVAAALAYIRRNAHRPISVADILEQVPATQRRLERGFQRHVGRTMLQELRRMRIRHAERLLVETDLTIERIATQSGFASRDKFFQAFRQQTGLTPARYRQQLRSHVLASE